MQEMSAGIGASSTSNPVGLMRWTRTVPAPGSGSIFAAYERYGSRRRAAMPAGTTPDTPSEVSTPASTRSNSRPSSAAARTRAVDTVSEPSRVGSVTWTPLAAPIASALRIVSGAFAGAIDTSVTSPPCASTSLSAASSAYSSLPLTTAGAAARSSRPSGPRRSAPDAGSGTGFTRTTMRTNRVPSPALGRGGRPDGGIPRQSSLPSNDLAITRRCTC